MKTFMNLWVQNLLVDVVADAVADEVASLLA